MGFGRVRGTNDWGLCFGEQKSEIFVFSFGELTIFYAIVGRIIGGLWRIIRSGLSWECRVGMNGNRKVRLLPQIRSRRENLLTSLESSTAGQILVDKKLHLDALLLAEWMMESSRFKYWFKCVFSVSLSPFLSEADQSRVVVSPMVTRICSDSHSLPCVNDGQYQVDTFQSELYLQTRLRDSAATRCYNTITSVDPYSITPTSSNRFRVEFDKVTLGEDLVKFELNLLLSRFLKPSTRQLWNKPILSPTTISIATCSPMLKITV